MFLPDGASENDGIYQYSEPSPFVSFITALFDIFTAMLPK